MTELTLEPYATRLEWQLGEKSGQDCWRQLLGRFGETLAERCDSAGKCVIGHIKGFAKLPDGGYLRVNVVSVKCPPDVAVQAPEDFDRLTLTLNVIVYGLSRSALERLTDETAHEVAAQFGATVSLI